MSVLDIVDSREEPDPLNVRFGHEPAAGAAREPLLPRLRKTSASRLSILSEMRESFIPLT
ncbi:hypothetical protein AT864_03067 [Anoxybacillus sp. P3H1B]|nr:MULTISPECIES: hypothetical protein [unclassified Anoxybacillus]KXG08650.1 hypothetical protein AT864_03067 [Anoxybacillus sp. P3H1B]MBB3906538.1 hypothetical protein [Anoxybacillus rupiensis]